MNIKRPNNQLPLNNLKNLFSKFTRRKNLFDLLNSWAKIFQMRIAKADNTAQYWPNLGSQQSAIFIGPVSLFASVKYWADDGGLFRLFKFTDLQSKLGLVTALY